MDSFRRSHRCVFYNNRIYIVGGYDKQLMKFTRKVVKYDMLARQWVSCAQIPYATVGAAVCSAEGKLYVIGGCSYGKPLETV